MLICILPSPIGLAAGRGVRRAEERCDDRVHNLQPSRGVVRPNGFGCEQRIRVCRLQTGSGLGTGCGPVPRRHSRLQRQVRHCSFHHSSISLRHILSQNQPMSIQSRHTFIEYSYARWYKHGVGGPSLVGKPESTSWLCGFNPRRVHQQSA